MEKRIFGLYINYCGYDKMKNFSWMKMLLTVLMLISFLSDVQARLTNEMELSLHDVYKRSPRRFYKFRCPRKQKTSRFLKSTSATGSLCETISLDKCESKHPQEIKLCKVCGITNSNNNTPMIINGKPVDPPYKYPWKVALIRGNMISCGASIISDSYILTAAHCVSTFEYGKDVPIHPEKLSVGFVTKTSVIELGPPVEKVIIHPEYNSRTVRYDAALLKLKKKITCGKYRNPVCLPPADLNINKDAVLHYAGWGTIVGERPHRQPNSLMEGTAKLVSLSECKARTQVEDDSHCLVGEGSSPCFGDSGGTMFYLHEKKFYTIGVASRVTHIECKTNMPFIYASIIKVVGWIEKVAGPRIKP